MPSIWLDQTWHISWQNSSLISVSLSLSLSLSLSIYIYIYIYIYNRTMHIYLCQIDPYRLLQSSIDLCKTITPHKLHIQYNAHIPMADCPPLQLSIDALNITTPHLADLVRSTGRSPLKKCMFPLVPKW